MPKETEEEKSEEVILTRNVYSKEKFMGVDKRNIVEAILFLVLLILILWIIPFTRIVRIISFIVLAPTLVIFGIRGIKHRSVLKMLSAEIKFRKYRRRLHLRGPEYVRKKVKTRYDESEDESLLEHGWRLAKERISQFIEQYGEEEDS